MDKEQDRVFSFSVQSTNADGLADIKRLKEHSKQTGISFSYLIIEALDSKNKELKLK